VRTLTPLFYALLGSCSLAAAAAADDGAVLSVRPDGVVVDVSQMEDVRRGTKLGFVREDGEREETGQGRVLSVKDGKALVKLAAKSVVKKGDLAVPCPDPNEDPYTDLRAALAEVQAQAGAGPQGRKKPGRVQAVAGELQAALDARDEAVESGLCDMAPHDSQIAALAENLTQAPAAPARAPGRGSRSAPADKAEEEPDDEQTSKSRPGGELSTTLSTISRILDALPGRAKRGRGDSAEAETDDGSTAGSLQEKDSLQSTIDIVGKLADILPSKSKRRGKRAEPATDEESRAPREERSPPEAAAPSNEPDSPTSGGSPSSGDAAGGTAGKQLPSSLDRILRDRTAKATPSAESRPPERAPGTRPESREAKSVSVAGRVIDSKGRPLAGARVAVGDLTTTTSKDGRFELASVKPGQYEVSVSATGFGPVKRTLSLKPGSRPLTFTLRAVQAAREGSSTTSSLKRPRKFGEVDE
jgi:hypothetical protein